MTATGLQRRDDLAAARKARVERVDLYAQRVSAKTEFLFVRLTTSGGMEGWGEATFNTLNAQIASAARILEEAIQGQPLTEAIGTLSAQPIWKFGRAYGVALHGLEMALLDAIGRAEERPVFTLLGAQHRSQVPCYANINRGTRDRSAEGWAARAQMAVDAGFKAVKLAPFDQVDPMAREEGRDAAGPGVAAVTAVREALGDAPDIMVDCHWRFDVKSALSLVNELADAKPCWVEAPVLETWEHVSDLCQIRRVANSRHVKLAGGEFLMGASEFAPFLEAEAYDVVNPDIRFCGTVGLVEVARQAASKSMTVSPHNHLGPVMTAASLHALAVVDNPKTIEIQFGESDVPPCVADADVFKPKNGILAIPSAPGWGVTVETANLTPFALG